MKVYIATGLENYKRQRELAWSMETHGFSLTYDWTEHGSVEGEQLWTIANIASAEANGVCEADVLVALLPGGRGTHAEIGMAIASGIPVVLYMEDIRMLKEGYGKTCAFYHHPLVKIIAAPWDNAEWQITETAITMVVRYGLGDFVWKTSNNKAKTTHAFRKDSNGVSPKSACGKIVKEFVDEEGSICEHCTRKLEKESK